MYTAQCSRNLTPWRTENWHAGFTCPGERSTRFDFSALFCFQVRSPCGTDWQTDRRV